MDSLNTRMLLVAGIVVVIFLSAAGWALDQAFRDSALASVRDRLNGQIFVLLGLAELEARANLVIRPVLPEAELNTPDSGRYAQVLQRDGDPVWRSPSMLGITIPAPAVREQGKFVFDKVRSSTGETLYSLGYTVLWETRDGKDAEVFTIQACERTTAFSAQVSRFRRGLWSWFAGVCAVLLIVQTAIMRWGLKPLRDVAAEVQQIELGAQAEISGRYPSELHALTSNLNALIRNNQRNIQRYRDALGDLAHSLKTPLAVMRSVVEQRTAGHEGDQVLTEQMDQLDSTIEYQLRRAATAGRHGIGPPIAIGPTVDRVLQSLGKIYAGRDIRVSSSIAVGARFFGDEGDLMEILGNVTDNAYKWTRTLIDIDIYETPFNGPGYRSAVKIIVRDDGEGMTPAEVEIALQRGKRLDQTTEGHGIGLAVVRDIVVDAYGGLMTIASDRGGTRIEIDIPLDRD